MSNITAAKQKKRFGKNKLRQSGKGHEKHPSDYYETNLQLGIFHFQKNDFVKAVMYLEKACAVKNDQAELFFILANTYKVLNDASKSEDCFKKALLLDPDNLEFLHNYGLLLHNLHRSDEAIKIFEKAIMLQPDSFEMLNDIGVLYHMLKGYKDAIHYFEKSLEINPNYVTAAINAGYTYLAIDDLLSANKIISQLGDSHNHNSEVIELEKQLSIALDKIGDDVLNAQTNLSFSDKSYQISPLRILKDFGEEKHIEKIGLSIVIPIRNERDNINILYKELIVTLSNLKQVYEIIFVDDGSTDGSREVLARVAEDDKNVRVIQFRRNYGQTAAMNAGFKYSRGSVVITLDGDLQNDPSDIPKLLEKMAEGYDLVSGLRKNRQDKLFTRKIPSMIANKIINKLIEGTGVQLHDFGCTLKAYKRGIIKNINLYGEMHRFIPAFAAWLGVKVAEVPVNHRPRIHGTPKYNLSRVSRVIFDMIVVRFFSDYMTRPIQFFGKIAKKLAGLGLIIISTLICLIIFANISVSLNTIILLSAIFLFAILQIVSIGLLGEIMMRSYFEGQKKDYYVVENIINDGAHSQCAELQG